MEIVKYVIAYKFLLGELPRYIVQSINIDENLDADFMHRLCESLVKGREVADIRHFGKPYIIGAFTNNPKFPNFCFACNTNADLSICRTCKMKKQALQALKEQETPDNLGQEQEKPSFDPNNTPKERMKEPYYCFKYEGTFMKQFTGQTWQSPVGKIILEFYEKKPLVINEWLQNKFKEEFEKQNKEFGWNLVGVTLVSVEPTGSYSDPSCFHPNEPYEMYWVRVQDMSQKEGGVNWIPGFKQNGKMWSVIGELLDPDSPDDTRPFHKSPFDDYMVVRIPEI